MDWPAEIVCEFFSYLPVVTALRFGLTSKCNNARWLMLPELERRRILAAKYRNYGPEYWLRTAAKTNQLELAVHAVERGAQGLSYNIGTAIRSGSLEIVMMLSEILDSELADPAIKYSARARAVRIFAWALEKTKKAPANIVSDIFFNTDSVEDAETMIKLVEKYGKFTQTDAIEIKANAIYYNSDYLSNVAQQNNAPPLSATYFSYAFMTGSVALAEQWSICGFNTKELVENLVKQYHYLHTNLHDVLLWIEERVNLDRTLISKALVMNGTCPDDRLQELDFHAWTFVMRSGSVAMAERCIALRIAITSRIVEDIVLNSDDKRSRERKRNVFTIIKRVLLAYPGIITQRVSISLLGKMLMNPKNVQAKVFALFLPLWQHLRWKDWNDVLLKLPWPLLRTVILHLRAAFQPIPWIALVSSAIVHENIEPLEYLLLHAPEITSTTLISSAGMFLTREELVKEGKMSLIRWLLTHVPDRYNLVLALDKVLPTTTCNSSTKRSEPTVPHAILPE